MAVASEVEGVWQTQPGDDGGYLQVTISACDSDSSKTCGKISKAFTDQGEDTSYEYLDKLMVWDMESDDGED